VNIIALAVAALSVACAAGKNQDQPVREAREQIRALANHYSGCKSVEVKFHAELASNGSSLRSAGKHVVLADGSVLSMDWAGFTGSLETVWITPPTSFKFRDPDQLVLLHTPQNYMKLGPKDMDGGRLPDDVQAYLMAPWPRVAEWCAGLEVAADLKFSRDAMVCSASSGSLGLELRWDEAGRLLAVRTGGGGDWREIEFGGMGPGEFFPPTHATQRIQTGKSMRPELVRTYDSIRFNLSDEQAAVSPDGVIGKLDRYEVTSGDVFKPNGEFRYNEPELLKTLAMKSSWGPIWARILWAALGVAVLMSGLELWRRRRGEREDKCVRA